MNFKGTNLIYIGHHGLSGWVSGPKVGLIMDCHLALTISDTEIFSFFFFYLFPFFAFVTGRIEIRKEQTVNNTYIILSRFVTQDFIWNSWGTIIVAVYV
jgi:hypothetical protein